MVPEEVVPMAVYEYRCADCDSTFAVTERISQHEKHSRRKPTCPQCKGRRTSRVYSSFYAKTSSKS